MLKRKDRMCRWVKGFSHMAFFPLYRTEITGQERLPQKDAFILLPKHQRWQDIPLIALATPRPLYYVAKQELFTNRLSGWFLESLGGIPLNRDQPIRSRSAIRAMMTLLKQGEGAVVFPEGTYFVNRMGPGKSGMLRLIISRTALPLIPAGIQYRRDGLKTRVRISFGNPIYPEEGVPAHALLDRVMQEIAGLSGLEQA